MGRQSNGRSSVYPGKDGYWHGRVTVGIRDDGRPDRRHTMSKDKAKVLARVRALEKERDSGTLERAGESWTVEAWLTHWLENIAAPFVEPNTLDGYRSAVNHHLIPGLGQHKLKKLKPEHLERLYLRIVQQPTKRGTTTKPATAHHAHRTLRAALNEAVRRGYLSRNPAQLARTPSIEEDEVEPYSLDEIKRIFAAAADQRNGARWVLALVLGLRQGEVLGLQWPDVDLERQMISIRRNRLRPRYEHGCGGKCGRKHAGYCPERIKVRPAAGRTKSAAGKRRIGLPDALCDLLKAHRAAQDEERRRAAQLWEGGEWVFSTPTGGPIVPWTDWKQWKRLLHASGVRDGRLHDARHTAATVLLMLEVSNRAMQAQMGWSNPAMAARYAHMVDPVRTEIADRLGVLLWPDDESGEAGTHNAGGRQTSGG
jgi:integrase